MSLQRDPKSLLWDAHEAAEVIAAVSAGTSFADFDRDIVLRSAVERQFEIIGEAPQFSRATSGARNSRSTGDHLACSGPLEEWPRSLSSSK